MIELEHVIELGLSISHNNSNLEKAAFRASDESQYVTGGMAEMELLSPFRVL